MALTASKVGGQAAGCAAVVLPWECPVFCSCVPCAPCAAALGDLRYAPQGPRAPSLACPHTLRSHVSSNHLTKSHDRATHATPAPLRRKQVSAYVEVHIEQGPVLEGSARPLAAVAGIAGQTRLFASVTGDQVRGLLALAGRTGGLVGGEKRAGRRAGRGGPAWLGGCGAAGQQRGGG